MKGTETVVVEKKPRRKRKANRFQKPVFVESELGKNNFINDLKIPFVFSKTQEEEVPELTKEGKLKRNKVKLEYIPFIKVFLKDDLQEDVIKLSLRSKEMLLYILYNLPRTKDMIALHRKEYMDLHGIKTEITYLGAVKELCKQNFIANTNQTRDVFWINPFYFFNGNRLLKYKDNIYERGTLMDMEDIEDNK